MTNGWLLSCGDALIDFMPTRTKDGQSAMRPVVGGSCLNIAVAMARLGAPTGFIGGLSTDMFGQMIAEHAEASGVDLRFCDRSDDQNTLAFVQLIDVQARYAFYDKATAARAWRFDAARFPWAEVDAVHIGSTTLIDDPTSAETLALARSAKPHTLVSLDPNCRPALVKDIADYRARIATFAKEARLIRLSDEDFAFLYGDANPDAVADQFLKDGADLVVLTLGRHGASAWHKAAGPIHVPAPEISVVDTIGAGDTFLAALLVALREKDALTRLTKLPTEVLGDSLRFASACAAITCSRAGANPPWRNEVN